MKALILGSLTSCRQEAVSALASLGYTDVAETSSEETAQRLMSLSHGGRPSTDLVLVNWEGADDRIPLLRWIREDAVCESIPVIVTSARTSLDDILRAAHEGADDYIITPFDAAELGRRLREVAGQSIRSGQSSLPDSSVPVSAPIPAQGSARESQNGLEAQVPSILVVEDNETTSAFIHHCLKNHYASVMVADLDAAIREVASRQFDALLVDISLNGESGVDLLEVLDGMPSYRNVPKIACTAFATEGDRERLLAIGFDAYISKPFRKQELLSELQAALTRS